MRKTNSVKNSKGEVFMEAILNRECNYLSCRWIGFVNEIEPAKEACMLITKMAIEFNAQSVVNDNREQKGPWPAINEWLGGVWIPSMGEAGIKRFGHIHSENIFTEMSAKNVLKEEVSGVSFQHFNSEKAAKYWALGVEA